MVGGKSGNSILNSILVFECGLEFSKEVIPSSEGHGGTGDGFFMEGVCPGQGRFFGHVQESEDDFLHVSVIGFFIDAEVKLDGMHPGDGHFVGAIEGFGFAELKFSRFH